MKKQPKNKNQKITKEQPTQQEFYCVVMALQSWSSFELVDNSFFKNLPITINWENSIGFLPVFKTREQAEKEYPNHEIIMLTKKNI